jgi:uncharacterized metal-binding protein YceD (DUF177 family)
MYLCIPLKKPSGMSALSPYSVPISGLKVGIHHFEYALDKRFFALFEGSPIDDAEVLYKVTLDKRHDMLLFDLELTGFLRTSCDRCTAPIHLPLQDSRSLVVKFGEAEGEAADEVVFIHRDSHTFNIASTLYEFSVLALPMVNVYDCELDDPRPCNQDILVKLRESTELSDNPLWDVLNDFKKQ